MNNFVILSDSCCDLDKATRETYGIDYVPMHFTVDGKEYTADLDWAVFAPHEFYELMREGKRVTTSQAGAGEFKERFEHYAKENTDVLYIGCSSALSASVKAAEVAAEDVKNRYPDIKIVCIDTLVACLGLGYITVQCAKLKAQGKRLEEIADFVEKEKLKFNQEATVESLHYLKLSGRISAASAFFGSILAVKPIIISDALGRNVAVEKVKGRQNSFRKIVERVVNGINTEKFKDVYLAHADCKDDIEVLAAMLKEKLPADVTYHTGYIGPIVGASVGPGTVGVYYYGKEAEKL